MAYGTQIGYTACENITQDKLLENKSIAVRNFHRIQKLEEAFENQTDN